MPQSSITFLPLYESRMQERPTSEPAPSGVTSRVSAEPRPSSAAGTPSGASRFGAAVLILAGSTGRTGAALQRIEHPDERSPFLCICSRLCLCPVRRSCVRAHIAGVRARGPRRWERRGSLRMLRKRPPARRRCRSAVRSSRSRRYFSAALTPAGALTCQARWLSLLAATAASATRRRGSWRGLAPPWCSPAAARMPPRQRRPKYAPRRPPPRSSCCPWT